MSEASETTHGPETVGTRVATSTLPPAESRLTETARGLWVVAYREILRFVQDRPRILGSLATPLLFLVIFGAGFNRVIGSMMPGVDFIKFVYPGIVAMNVLMTSLFSGLSMVWDREFGFMRELLVAPIGRTGILLGKTTGAAVQALVQAVLLLALAPALGLSLSLAMVGKLLPLLVLTSVTLSGLGMLLASRMRSQQGFQVLMQLLIFPLIFLAGVFFPVNDAPAWLSFVSKVNPVTYGVDAIRQLFLGPLRAAPAVPGAPGSAVPIIGVTVLGHTMTILQDAAVVALTGVILMAAAIWSFNRQA